MFEKHFKFIVPSALAKEVFATEDKKKNNKLVNVINSGLIDLKKEIEEMSEEQKKFQKPNKIVNIVAEILEFNRKKQSGGGLKVLTPNQMLSRLPITLAQLNLKMKLDNYYILCTDQKKLTKQLYKSLIDII